jgi:hypothetical protein
VVAREFVHVDAESSGLLRLWNALLLPDLDRIGVEFHITDYEGKASHCATNNDSASRLSYDPISCEFAEARTQAMQRKRLEVI